MALALSPRLNPSSSNRPLRALANAMLRSLQNGISCDEVRLRSFLGRELELWVRCAAGTTCGGTSGATARGLALTGTRTCAVARKQLLPSISASTLKSRLFLLAADTRPLRAWLMRHYFLSSPEAQAVGNAVAFARSLASKSAKQALSFLLRACISGSFAALSAAYRWRTEANFGKSSSIS